MNAGSEEYLLLFKTIFDQTPISTQIFTPNGDTIMVNKAWEKLWNVKFEQMNSYNILRDKQLVESGTMPYIKRGFRGEMVNLPAIEYAAEKTVKIKGASTRFLSARMYPIKDKNGKISHIVLQHEDITDRKNANEALKKSEERFRTLTSHAPVGIFLTDKDGNCLFVNERWSKFAGMKRSEAIGTGWLKALHPEDRNRVYGEWYEFAKSGKEFTAEYRFLTPKGKVTWLKGSAIALHDGKKLTGYMGTVSDITARRITSDSLKVSEERLRLALDAGRIGVWDWDIINNKLAWTDKVFEIHGVSKNNFKVTFENFSKLIHPEDKNEVIERIEKSLKEKKDFDIEFRIITPRNELRWIATRGLAMFDKKGEPLRMLGATSNVTNQKQIEQEKSDFISLASHELKTPITSMKMFADLLHRDLKKTGLQKSIHFAERIKEQTNKLIDLTNDLLDVSRIETGKLQLKKEDFNMADLVKESIETLQATTHHALVFNKSLKAHVFADKYRIYQVLVNLITNAIKYSPDEEKIIIEIQKKNEEVIVSIKDKGIGIAKEKQTKIFDRLYQVADNKLKTFPGLGLGLYISKEIMERHGGRLWLKSAKGKGSTFYFSLSVAKKH